MQYTEVLFRCAPDSEVVTDILSAMLGGIGFESFVKDGEGLRAYVPHLYFNQKQVNKLIADFPVSAEIHYTFRLLEDKNWNEEWEKNYFRPILIDNQCCIHSSFHKPEGSFQYEIMIDPKMAFGTGYHQTTRLMLQEILAMEMTQKRVLDMGCGTGVLAILAAMKGAASVTAIDIDEWAYRNALENMELNNIASVCVEHGDAQLLENDCYDLILANINRNVLLKDLPSYAAVLNQGGVLVMSGFYLDDLPDTRFAAEQSGLVFDHFGEMDHWVATTFAMK